MIELTGAKQRREEPVTDYINQWRSLSLKCKDNLAESSTIIGELKEVNLGTVEHPRPTYVSALLNLAEEAEYIAMLTEFQDAFAWTYTEIPGLDPKVEVHHLALKKGGRPVKQGQWRFRTELVPSIEAEVNRSGWHRRELTAFRTPKTVYCYKLMPFELKNAGATDQRAMKKIFDDMLHRF
ncbi:hypothetical protein LIER_18095 [Lithospermum erythrorhizon]|uniref:Retrotransposon gag domain-containing protein n=1 Tax=Lithospermum erythrorhizon TaxID=34254 RepID=A0AAV3QFB6_LITER